MPKRRNPFADFVPVQWKTHVGVKEVANGIMHEELMKEVYDRTQEKLFSGAKRSTDSDLNANHAPSRMDPASSAVGWNCRVDPQQMMLDGAGHLVCPPSGWSSSPEQSEMECSDRMTDVKARQPASPFTDIQCGQGISCGQFSSWMHCDSAAFRYHSPVASPPATGSQLCPSSSGQLTEPQQSSMDCDADLHPPFSSGSEREEERKGSAAGGVVGLERWGFLSAKTCTPQVGTRQTSMKCATCRHIPGSVSCHFCERRLCGGCGRQCHACGHSFCPLCSTMDYDTSVERAFCLSCVG